MSLRIWFWFWFWFGLGACGVFGVSVGVCPGGVTGEAAVAVAGAGAIVKAAKRLTGEAHLSVSI